MDGDCLNFDFLGYFGWYIGWIKYHARRGPHELAPFAVTAYSSLDNGDTHAPREVHDSSSFSRLFMLFPHDATAVVGTRRLVSLFAVFPFATIISMLFNFGLTNGRRASSPKDHPCPASQWFNSCPHLARWCPNTLSLSPSGNDAACLAPRCSLYSTLSATLYFQRLLKKQRRTCTCTFGRLGVPRCCHQVLV